MIWALLRLKCTEPTASSNITEILTSTMTKIAWQASLIRCAIQMTTSGTTGVAGQRAVAQILSYMGDIADEEESAKVRGILVPSSFDAKARAAVRMAPGLVLRKYSVRFLFSDGHASSVGAACR